MSHNVVIERRTNGTFSPISWGAKIQPNEPIRLHARGLKSTKARAADFYLRNWAGRAIFNQTVNIGLVDDAFLDIAAPTEEGVFSVDVWANHSVSVTFQVAKDAPKPPPPPPGGALGGAFGQITGGVSGVFSNIKTFGIIAVVLIGLIAVTKYLPGRKK